MAVIIILVTFASSSPRGFPAGTSLDITKGSTLREVADILYDEGYVRSKTLFMIYATMLDGTAGVKTGEYIFSKPESVLKIAQRLVNGDHGFETKKITIPEGTDIAGIAKIIKKALPNFDDKTFLQVAKNEEGYLLPETYFWPTNVKPDDVVRSMKTSFDRAIKKISSEIDSFGRDLSDVITMASIVEREANNSTDRKLVAGILWRRLDINMPLQVDAPFYYLTGKTSAQLTKSDLSTQSAYNTYTKPGLTPTPIANPGIDAIRDTINPTRSQYLFFLTGDNGKMYYAKDLDGHVINKYKYID